MNSDNRHWLVSRPVDLLLLLLPVWVLWAVFFSNASYFQSIQLPLWAWVVFILGLDVSHVWSSLFRTYLDKEEFSAHKNLLILTPILVIAASIGLMSISMGWFWRIMAYLAVFHFIKQQYGFVALYKLKAREKHTQFISDKWIVYIATIYPVVYWHFNPHAQFNWFVEDDFFQLSALFANQQVWLIISTALNVIYWLLLAIWLFQELRAFRREGAVSVGKILWIITTAVNWWFGIVYFNSDLIFSVSNVVAHGIPYMVLIYFYGLKKQEIKTTTAPSFFWRARWVFVLLSTILIIAVVEEYFWDMLIYREHGVFFETIYPYNWNQLTQHWMVIVAVALLAMPQQVHYVIDGFIWKMNAKNTYVKAIFKPKS